MAKYFIYLMLIATTLVFSSCGDDEEIYDVDFSEVSLEEGQSRIIGDWYENAHIVYFVKGPTLYYQVHISETEMTIKGEPNDILDGYNKVLYIENWSKVGRGIRIKVYSEDPETGNRQKEDDIYFYRIMDKRLYTNTVTYLKYKEIED